MRSPRLVALAALALVAGCVAPTTGAPEPAGRGDADAWLAAQWGTATEQVLVDETFAVSKAPTRAGGVFTPGERLVLPGTDRVEVTLTWDAAPGAPSALQLIFDSGGTAGRPETREVSSGEPVVIDGAGAADGAFQPHSHWWFGGFPLDDAIAVPETAVRMQVVAHRALELPRIAVGAVAPGIVLDAAQAANRGAGPLCPMCEGTAFSSGPGAIVTSATRVVRATIAYEGETDPPGIVAWTPVAGEIEMEQVEPGVWEAAPPAEALDSPYQTKSLWWFFLVRPVPVQSGTTTLTVETVG